MKLKEMILTGKAAVFRTANKTGMKVRKYSPEILLGTGLISFAGTVVMACKATLHAEDILKHHKHKMNDIKVAAQLAEVHPEQYEYDESMIKRDKTLQYFKTGVEFAKLYAPSIALGMISIGCILTSRNILQKRYLATVTAYEALSTAFNSYRERVRTEAGEIMDRHYLYGTELETVEKTIVDEHGKKKKITEVQEKDGTMKIPTDGTERFFDKTNKNWDSSDNNEFNLMFLRTQENFFSDLLRTRGHVFLNEVYDALGFKHTTQGQVIGWVYGAGGDNYIDFGLYNDEKGKKFINGMSNDIMLEFNHDGIIWDKI